MLSCRPWIRKEHPKLFSVRNGKISFRFKSNNDKNVIRTNHGAALGFSNAADKTRKWKSPNPSAASAFGYYARVQYDIIIFYTRTKRFAVGLFALPVCLLGVEFLYVCEHYFDGRIFGTLRKTHLILLKTVSVLKVPRSVSRWPVKRSRWSNIVNYQLVTRSVYSSAGHLNM